jgi:hypothetical protein
MRCTIRLHHTLLVTFGTIVVVAASGVGVIAYPQPLYAYHVEEGRLQLHSDRPFDQALGRAVLADVELRLAKVPAELADTASTYRVFVTNVEWRRRLVFLWSYGAGGVNYYPIASNVFIRQSDIDADRVLRSDGRPVAAPRTLAYYAGHEIGHSLIGKHVGAYANWQLPAWVREGMADYVGFGGKVDIDSLARSWRAGDPDLDPAKSGSYSLYRLLVAYLLERQGWSVDRLLSSHMKRAEAEQLLEAGMPQR